MWNNIWNTNYIFYYPYLEDIGDENLNLGLKYSQCKKIKNLVVWEPCNSLGSFFDSVPGH